MMTSRKPLCQEIMAEPGDETIEMDRMSKLIAGNMVKSKRVSPHVTSFLEADITALADWRETSKGALPEKGTGETHFYTYFY